jgi:hypothetical protein
VDSEARAELVFGIVAAIGTPLDFVVESLKDDLATKTYASELLHLSRLMDVFGQCPEAC